MMPFIYENHYEFNINAITLETIHTKIEALLAPLPESIYSDFLIALHELIINSCQEMKYQNTIHDTIYIHIYQHVEVIIIQVCDSGRGISQCVPVDFSTFLGDCGRGLSMVMLLMDWFLVYYDLKSHYYSYYIIKKINTF